MNFTRSARRDVADSSQFHSIEASRSWWSALCWPSVWLRVCEASSSAASARSCLSPWNNWSFSTLACFCRSKGILDKVALSSVGRVKKWHKRKEKNENSYSSREPNNSNKTDTQIESIVGGLNVLSRELFSFFGGENICLLHLLSVSRHASCAILINLSAVSSL